ncbi:hypothetical protein [Oscillatoria sp. FACHB-1406]|uniref:hypothetical protein n=1 Tax=Oscillatoria sp. FACHB-1406 TaxID=2692846 RepID=UPI00168618B0|nr:hypothetical protein [Oscillatoria sp. FACHB-1406]MBD2576297.1 hypothetical protein [Oscillatoria sp. FACHB-1406]
MVSVFGSSLAFLPKGISQSSEPSLKERYRAAVQDAALVEEGEDFNELLALVPENSNLIWNEDKTKVLVTTWKSQSSYDRFIKPARNVSSDENRLLWVTLANQVKDFCHQYLTKNPNATEEDVKLRLKQYLGLDPNWQYDVFVEMWVDPADIFRPCVDPEVTDTKCNLKFGEEKPKVAGATLNSAIADYPLFFKNLYYISIRNGLQPFTGLGYTYDWGNPSHPVGASEFILIPGAAYTVKDEPILTLKYCQHNS